MEGEQERKGIKGFWQKLKSTAQSRKPWRSVRRMFGLDALPPVLRRVIVGVIGGTILLVGVAMLVLPGPAFIVIPVGLVVLATEFIWARRSLRKVKDLFNSAKSAVGK